MFYFLSKVVAIAIVIFTLVGGPVNGSGTPTPPPMTDIFEFPEAPPVEILVPIVNASLAMDEDCQLPCFWGFRLNKTPIEETTSYVTENFRQIPVGGHAIGHERCPFAL
jgi:hypothetical protein